MTTITTTAAATQVGVTVATIRTWCRRNVIAATKVAGRWVIDTASLAHRITIGAMRATRRTTVLDLDATYTYTHDLGDGPEAFTITPKIHVRERSGAVITSIGGLHALLADRIDAITDLGDRLHTITVLGGARIVISDTALKPGMLSISSRDDGRIRTTYTGTRDLPVDAVLDLAEQLRTQLSK